MWLDDEIRQNQKICSILSTNIVYFRNIGVSPKTIVNEFNGFWDNMRQSIHIKNRIFSSFSKIEIIEKTEKREHDEE